MFLSQSIQRLGKWVGRLVRKPKPKTELTEEQLRQLKSGATHQHRYGEIAGLEDYPIPPTWERRYLWDTLLSDQYFEAGSGIPA